MAKTKERQKRNKKQKNKKKKKKSKKVKKINIKKVVEKWKIWDNEEETVRLEKEVKKLVPE